MAREKETYRDNLERLYNIFGDKQELLYEDIKRVLNRDIKTLKADKDLIKYGFKKRAGKWSMMQTGLARYLS